MARPGKSGTPFKYPIIEGVLEAFMTDKLPKWMSERKKAAPVAGRLFIV